MSKPFIKAFIFAQTGQGYSHVRAVFQIFERNEDDTVTSVSSSLNNDLPYVECLQINSQTDPKCEYRNPFYGFEVRYHDIYSTNLRSLERCVKTLRSIENKLRKLNSEYGYPATLGDYFNRVFKVLKVKAVESNASPIPLSSVSSFVNSLAGETLKKLKGE